jgi:hypothetical protein
MESGVPMFLKGATYPIELFHDAVLLRDRATAEVANRLDDGRNLPTPGERAHSRAAIFASFNFLESLLIELAQDHVTNGPGKGTPYGQIVLDDLKNGRANISRTMQEWTLRLTGKDVLGNHRCREFKAIRQLRNQLIHPKFEPLEAGELTQDKLLRRANAEEAAWFVGRVNLMAVALYMAFHQPVPPEIRAEAGKAPKFPPARV